MREGMPSLCIPLDSLLQKIAKRHDKDPVELKAALIKELSGEVGGAR